VKATKKNNNNKSFIVCHATTFHVPYCTRSELCNCECECVLYVYIYNEHFYTTCINLVDPIWAFHRQTTLLFVKLIEPNSRHVGILKISACESVYYIDVNLSLVLLIIIKDNEKIKWNKPFIQNESNIIFTSVCSWFKRK